MNLSGDTAPGQSGPGSNGNEEKLQSTMTGASPSDFYVLSGTHVWRVLSLCRDAVSVLYRLNRLGWEMILKHLIHSLAFPSCSIQI